MGKISYIEGCVVKLFLPSDEGNSPPLERDTTYRCVGQPGCKDVEIVLQKNGLRKEKNNEKCPNIWGLGAR